MLLALGGVRLIGPFSDATAAARPDPSQAHYDTKETGCHALIGTRHSNTVRANQQR